ncbi:MAG: LuxR C-terminal-related transcriptional regulator [Candidatus Nanopelagicales bacterium]
MRHGREHIPRAGLTRHRTAISRARVTTIVAPPGGGKSALLGQLAGDEDPVTIVPMALTGLENDPIRFKLSLGRALAEALPTLGWDVELPPRPGDPADLAAAIAARARPDRPFAIAVDDAHVLTAAEVYDAMAHVIATFPEDVRFVLATRRAPDLDLARLRVEGGVHDLSGVDLAFDADEVRALAASSRVAIGEGGVERILDETAGWPAGVSAMMHEPRRWRAALDELLEQLVVPALSATARDFAEEAAFAADLGPETLDAVRESADSVDLLDLLDRGVPLPQAVDGEGVRRLPHAVARHFRKRLERRDPGRAARLAARAAALSSAVPLTLREREVLARLGGDATAARIAAELGVSYHTVKAHQRSLYAKLGVATRTAAVSRATTLGLLP